MELYLFPDWLPSYQQEAAQCAYDEGDGFGFAHAVDNHHSLMLVQCNDVQLKARGVFEEALLAAYTGCRVNNRHVPIKELQRLFDLADREKLLALGDPLPDGEQFTIYRGVSGVGKQRKVRSFSWTLDYDRALWFANRLDLPDPAVYEAVVYREEVLSYNNERQEQEVICRPRSCSRIPASETATT